MRIMLVSDHYPPFIGGAQRQTQLLAHELRARGHMVSVATVWQPKMASQEDDEGITVYRLKQIRTSLPWGMNARVQQHQPPFPDPVTVWQLRRLISRLQPEVVHAYGWFAYSAALALAGMPTPLLLSARDYSYFCATRTLLYRGHNCSGPAPSKCLACAGAYYGRPKGWLAALGVALSAPLLRQRVTGLHSISTYVQAVMRRHFIDDQDVTERARPPHAVIPSFRAPEHEAEPPADGSRPGIDGLATYLSQLPAVPYLLFVGALRGVKGLKPLLAAYAQLNEPPPLVLIGTPESDTPRDLPAGAMILESFPHAAIMAAWDRCLFGVLPSLWAEPLGSVVYEGMSRGKAVIGTTPGGHTDMIVPGETGLLVPAGDVPALARAMQCLLNDPGLRDRLGQAASVRANLFTARVTIPQFEQVYEELRDIAARRIHEN